MGVQRRGKMTKKKRRKEWSGTAKVGFGKYKNLDFK